MMVRCDIIKFGQGKCYFGGVAILFHLWGLVLGCVGHTSAV
jgi:hypothetical protein